MKLHFHKYQGSGNDFILIDNRDNQFNKNDTKLVQFLCDRRYGIGADGLILLENDNTADFRMNYYNSDGLPGSLCGNGGRCIVAFANSLGIIDDHAIFNASDGPHEARIDKEIVSLRMQEVVEIREKPNYLFLDTGSPHHVQLITGLRDFKVAEEGARLRYGLYGARGSNINFVEECGENEFSVRTYERGVEAETLSCGTGVTAVALGMHHLAKAESPVTLHTPGGALQVSFEKKGNKYTNIILKGPARLVFKGELRC